MSIEKGTQVEDLGGVPLYIVPVGSEFINICQLRRIDTKDFPVELLKYILEKLPAGQVKEAIQVPERFAFKAISLPKWSEHVLNRVSPQYNELRQRLTDFGNDKGFIAPYDHLEEALMKVARPDLAIKDIFADVFNNTGILLVYKRIAQETAAKVDPLTFKQRFIGAVEFEAVWPGSVSFSQG